MEQATNEHTDIKFYLSSRDTWQAMYEDCLAAKKSIEFEQYILMNDPLGKQFMQMFADKAKQGVAVRLLLDKVGSRSQYYSPMVKEIKKNGGEVYFYNPIRWLNLLFPKTWFPRNHTKTLLIDSRVAYTGGVCIAEYMKTWRDTQARFTGSLAEQVQREFQYVWGKISKRLKVKRNYSDRNKKVKNLFRYVVHLPKIQSNPVYKELLSQIRAAEKEIYLVSPFFLPPIRLRRALYKAIRRGVKVQVMGSDKTDVPVADRVAHSYYPRFLRRGIKIYIYKTTILHAKYAVVDDRWATIGSTNLDYLSLLRNREANIITEHPETIAELKKHFHNDLINCIEIGPDYWYNAPVLYRLIGYLFRPFRKIL